MSTPKKAKPKHKINTAYAGREHVMILFDCTDSIDNICENYKSNQISVMKMINLIRQLKNTIEELTATPPPSIELNINNKAHYHDTHVKAANLLQELNIHKQKIKSNLDDDTIHLIHGLVDKIIASTTAFLSLCPHHNEDQLSYLNAVPQKRS